MLGVNSLFISDSATTEIYTLSLHDALPISAVVNAGDVDGDGATDLLIGATGDDSGGSTAGAFRSEEHTSELQSHSDLVCRLLLEKKKNRHKRRSTIPRNAEESATTAPQQ